MNVATPSVSASARVAPDGNPLAEVTSPYPGPRPFRRADAGRFFGRSRETGDLIDLVQTYGLIVLYAQSGCGKTSLLDAGLIPRIMQSGYRVLSGRVGGEEESPSGRSSAYLKNLLSTLYEGDRALVADADLDSLARGSVDEALHQVFRELDLVSAEAPASGAARDASRGVELTNPVLLVVDQFEELFTTHVTQWRARRDFLTQLGKATRRIRDLHILLAIREDFIAELDPYASAMPDGLRIRYRLERLRREEVKQVITEPLKSMGVVLGEGLSTRIVSDLMVARAPGGAGDSNLFEGEYAEPVHVQLACEQLWNSLRAARPIGGEADAEPNAAGYGFCIGDIRYLCSAASVQGIDDALASMYRAAVHRAAREGSVNERRIRQFTTHVLITSNSTRGVASLDAFRKAGLSERVVKSLLRDRILSVEPRRGVAWYEITHDRFIGPILRDDENWSRHHRFPWMLGTLATLALLVAAMAGFLHYKLAELDRVKIARPLIYVGSGTVYYWIKQHAPAAVDKVALQAHMGTYDALLFFLAANGHGGGPDGPAVFTGVAGTTGLDDVKELMSNQFEPPRDLGGRVYAIHLGDDRIYAWVKCHAHCPNTTTWDGAREPDDPPKLSTRQVAEYIEECAKRDCDVYLPEKRSGTRKTMKIYFDRLTAETPAHTSSRASILKLFEDDNKIWGNSLRPLEDCESRFPEQRTCLALGSFVEDTAARPDERIHKYELCESDDHGHCSPLTNPLFLLSRSLPHNAEFGLESGDLGMPECTFLTAVASAAKINVDQVVTKVNSAKCRLASLGSEALRLMN